MRWRGRCWRSGNAPWSSGGCGIPRRSRCGGGGRAGRSPGRSRRIGTAGHVRLAPLPGVATVPQLVWKVQASPRMSSPGLAGGLASGLVAGVSVGITVGVDRGLPAGTAIGLLAGLMAGFANGTVQGLLEKRRSAGPRRLKQLRWKELAAAGNLAVGLTFGLVFGLALGLTSGLASSLPGGLLVGAATGLAATVL